MVTGRVEVQGGDHVVEAANDVGVEIPMAIAACSMPASVGCAFESRVGDARAGAGLPNLYNPK